MGLNAHHGGALLQRRTKLRQADITYIASRLEHKLVAARAPLTTEEARLHNVCRTAISTVVEMTQRTPPPVPFDVYDGLGELRDVLLDIIRREYRLILDPEPVRGLINTLAMATGGLMLRAAVDLLDPDLEREVDLQLSALMRCVA